MHGSARAKDLEDRERQIMLRNMAYWIAMEVESAVIEKRSEVIDSISHAAGLGFRAHYHAKSREGGDLCEFHHSRQMEASAQKGND